MKWIEKKDLVYWLLIILLIWLLSSDFGIKNPIVLDNWNFTSTIVSIILAVLAIVYTFAQSSTTFYSTNKLEESAKKIEEVSTKLEETSVDTMFEKIDNHMKALEDKIGNVTQSVDDSMAKHFHENFSTIIDSLPSSSFETEKSNLDENAFFTKDQWTTYLTRLNGSIREALVYVYFLEKYQVSDKFADYVSWVVKGNYNTIHKNRKSEEQSVFLLIQLFQVILVFNSLKVFSIKNAESEISIKNINSEFREAIESLIDGDSHMIDKRVMRYFQEKNNISDDGKN